MEKDKRLMHRLTWVWLALWIFQFPVHSCASYMVLWSAFVELQYFNTETNQTTTSMCECGWSGSASPQFSASGDVALPKSDLLACTPNATFAVNHTPWIALIKRGNCSYDEKIQAAQREGASAVVIYNLDGTGNTTNPMSLSGINNIVAITISNHLGKQITSLVQSGTMVYMRIKEGNPYKFWGNPVWVYIMSFAFFGITAVILGYFVFVVIKRLYRNRQLRIQQRKLKKVAERAIAKLQVRTLRRTDPEVEAEENSCAVCIDSFRRGDIVTTLPCSHIFHKTCIEPWLLEHHTCPMCKYDILKGEVGVEPSQESSMPTADVRFYPSSVSGSLAESPAMVTSLEQHAETRPHLDVQTADCAIRVSDHVTREDHIYENPAFEEEQQITDHQTRQV
ncbi:RING finger protein 148 [Salminus brasiliensis]|uniref:RING finger protein 148 n=1 Tax=Salminus brasiliensis TaxID=930266 RepID=UPI003B833193